MKKSKKIDKYLDLGRELKKLCNIKVKVIQAVVGALWAGLNGLEQKSLEELDIRGRIETIETRKEKAPIKTFVKTHKEWNNYNNNNNINEGDNYTNFDWCFWHGN